MNPITVTGVNFTGTAALDMENIEHITDFYMDVGVTLHYRLEGESEYRTACGRNIIEIDTCTLIHIYKKIVL